MEIVSDDEVLRAALDFVDAFADGDGTGRVTTKPRTGGSSHVKAPSPSTRLRTEILALRRERQALEIHLAILKQSHQASPGVTDPTAIVRSAWEALASRQRKLRQEAEGENEALRARLLEQTRAARRLHKLIRKQCWQAPSLPRFANCGPPGTPRLQNLALVDHMQLLAQVHHMYDQTHSIFDAPQFVAMASEPEPARNLVTHDDPQLGRTVEIFESRVYPYDYRLLSDAVWNPLAQLAMPGKVAADDKRNPTTERSVNTELSFETGPPATPYMGILLSKIVGRHMQHDGRHADVVIWATTLDVVYGRQRVLTIAKIWMLIRPLTGVHSSAASIVQVFMQSTRPQSTAQGPGRCSREMPLDEYESCLRAYIDDYWTHVEALLLDKSWGRDASARHAKRGGSCTRAT